jgi:peptide/nickel transport system substrate-binding protein
LTAYDVAASWNKIVDPPEDVISARGYYSMIQTVEAPNAKTVVFRLKYATSAFDFLSLACSMIEAPAD